MTLKLATASTTASEWHELGIEQEQDGYLAEAPDATAANSGSNVVSILLNDGVWADTKTFVGPGSAGSGGNWSTAANWSPAGVPGAGDHVAIAANSVNLSANATVASLTLSGGAVLRVSQNGGRVLRSGGVAVNGTSKLDLRDNDLIIDYAGGAGSSPIGAWTGSGYGGVIGMIARGYNGNAWDGSGLVTTMAEARSGLTTLAPAEAAGVFGLSGNQTAL